MKPALLISACLTGETCRYDGRSNLQPDLLKLLADYRLVPVCPEVAGGLPTPRPPAEIQGTRVRRANGEDVTAAFQKGAEVCLAIGREAGAQQAILKSRSPACGCGRIYDGSFSGRLIAGDGVFTQRLKADGITCISDENYLAEKQSR
jgi:uncharacterized protein YbbK (DUF523 family)